MFYCALLAGGGFTYTLPGEGDVPLGEMIGLLKQRGYDGYLSVEWEKHWVPALAGPEVSLPAHAAFLRRWCVAAAAGQYIGQDALAERPAASP